MFVFILLTLVRQRFDKGASFTLMQSLQSSQKSDIYSLDVIFTDIADEFCECLGQLVDDMCEQETAKCPTLEEVTKLIEEFIMENH